MKIKKATTPCLLDNLKTLFLLFYLPYCEKEEAQSLHDQRQAILKELYFRNEKEYKKTLDNSSGICYNEDTPREKGNDDND